MLRVNDITRLYLGIQGENNQKTIEIDVSYWLETYPNATITIWHKRNGDTTPEPVPGVLDRTNKILRWTPTTTDTYVAGEGEGEIRLTENNVIKKSVSFITGVAPSITGVGSLTGSGWQDYLAATEAAKNAAATSATNAATSESNAAGSATAAASSATAAAGSATNAASSATAAGNSATAAGNSANAAAGSATAAGNSATAAGNSASAAASSASSANSSKTAAATSATNAANSATAAGSSATAASGSATNAAASATAAAGSASNAANSETAAGNSATAAANSATAASGSASSAAQSAAAAAASAAQTTAEVVRAWLNEHVDPDTGYVIDDSLTIQGAAADAKKVGDAVSDLKSALGDNGLAQPIMDGWVNGKRWSTPAPDGQATGAEYSLAAARYVKVPCSVGDVFTINATGYSAYRPWAFFDSNNVCLLREESNLSVENKLITAPTNTAYLAINQDANRGQCYVGELMSSSVDRRINALESSMDTRMDGLEESITPQLNQIITFYDISSLESFDAKADLPLNRYTYGTYAKLASTFTGTDAPNFGFMDSNKIRIEKRPVSGLSNDVYILLIDNVTLKQHFEMQALVNATPPFRWVLPDTTLTKANVAADARATAQAIGAATADCMAQSVAYDYPNNLYDKTTGGTSGYWNGTGYHTTSGSLRITHPIQVKNGVTYIMPFDAGGLGSNNWIAKVDSSGTFISAISGVIADGKLTFTADFTGYVSANMGRLTDDNYYFSALYSREINPLFRKKLSVNGDSICAGAGYAGGYAKMIGLRNNMLVQNIAVTGATITTGTKFANTGEDRHWISTSIGDMAADADYIILEGGINDDATVIGENKLGTLTGASTFSEEFDNTTFCGALEYMFSQVYARFPGKKIGFIIVHKAAVLLNSNGIAGSNRYPLIVNACKKWGIPYLDLNTECPPLNYIPALKSAYTNNGDGWHPNEAGYAKYYVPKIEEWMKTL